MWYGFEMDVDALSPEREPAEEAGIDGDLDMCNARDAILADKGLLGIGDRFAEDELAYNVFGDLLCSLADGGKAEYDGTTIFG